MKLLLLFLALTTNSFASSAIPGIGSGDMFGPSSSVDGEMALFDSTTGKLLKRATGTGVCKATSGVFSTGNVALGSEISGTLPVSNGGTGQTTYTDGQLLIGNSTGNTLTKASLTAGANITITPGAGSITIASTGGSSDPEVSYRATLNCDSSSAITSQPTTAWIASIGNISSGSCVVTMTAANFVDDTFACVATKKANATLGSVAITAKTSTTFTMNGAFYNGVGGVLDTDYDVEIICRGKKP